METNSKRILEALPDYTDFLAIMDKIKELALIKMKLENGLKRAESNTFKLVMTDEKYFKSGKPMAVSYFENGYKYSGIDDELIKFRDELAEVTVELDNLRAKLDLYKQMQDMYKSMVFAERSIT